MLISSKQKHHRIITDQISRPLVAPPSLYSINYYNSPSLPEICEFQGEPVTLTFSRLHPCFIFIQQNAINSWDSFCLLKMHMQSHPVFVAGLLSGNAFLRAFIPTGCEETRQAHSGIGKDKPSKLKGRYYYTCFCHVYLPLSQTILWPNFVSLGWPKLIMTVVR